MKILPLLFFLATSAFSQPWFSYGVQNGRTTDTAFVDSVYMRASISDSITAFGRSGTQDADFDSAYARALATASLNFQNVSIYESDSDVLTLNAAIMTIVLGALQVNGGIGFFGKEPVTKCTLSHDTPPNPVMEAQARAEYDLSMQNCLTTQYGLIGVPAP